MISALTLLLAAQEKPRPPMPAFHDVLEEANKAWYQLPQATTTFTMKQRGKEDKAVMQAAWDGERTIFRVFANDKPQIDVRSDGSQVVTLAPERRAYQVSPATPRPSWEAREIEKEAGQEEQVSIAMTLLGGLVVRTGQKTPKVYWDTPETYGEEKVRRILAQVVGAKIEGKGTNRIFFKLLIDQEKGYLRYGEIKVTDFEKSPDPLEIEWRALDKAPENAEYTVDLDRLKGWTKIEGGRDR